MIRNTCFTLQRIGDLYADLLLSVARVARNTGLPYGTAVNAVLEVSQMHIFGNSRVLLSRDNRNLICNFSVSDIKFAVCAMSCVFTAVMARVRAKTLWHLHQRDILCRIHIRPSFSPGAFHKRHSTKRKLRLKVVYEHLRY